MASTAGPDVRPLSDSRLELGEGAIWTSLGGGTFLWVDILVPALFAMKGTGGDVKRIRLPSGAVGTVVPIEGRENEVLVALRQSLAIVDLGTGECRELCAPPAESVPSCDWRFNDGKVGPDGRLWVGTMGQPPTGPVGTLYVLEPASSLGGATIDTPARLVPVLSRQVTISNGLSWSADGSAMFYIDTPAATVAAYDYSPGCTELRSKRVAVQFEKRVDDEEEECVGGWPDGCCMEPGSDRLWVARWGGGEVSCFDVAPFVSSSSSSSSLTVARNGTTDEIDAISLPNVTRVSSLAIGGEDGRTMLITTAQEGMSEAQRQEEKESNAGKVFVVRRPEPAVSDATAPRFAKAARI